MTTKYDPVYRGKAKTLYMTDSAQHLILEFRDDTSAFDGEKIAQLANKGRTNNIFNAAIMERLQAAGIATHFEKRISDTESLVKHLHMLPVECVIRNVATGSLCRRLGVEQGLQLNPPVFEFFLKNDALKDPMINESHMTTFGWASENEIAQMKEISFKVNDVLRPMFAEAGMNLVDFKIEFGRFQGRMMVGDEFTPDGCRIWDMETGDSLDKDRFRKDLGNVVTSYEEVARRLNINFEKEIA